LYAGWNGLAYGVYLVNTQGVTLLVNYFFGVVFNTMRGIAFNVENMVKQFADRFFIFRTAWLYGDGKNFVKTMLRLAETNDQVSVVKDQVGSPTSTKELAGAIAHLLFTENYGLFHATCEGSCSWADFAEEIFRLAGKNTKVNHITSEEFAAKAPRPSYSILENYMLKLTSDYRFADWHDAIESYIKGMK